MSGFELLKRDILSVYSGGLIGWGSGTVSSKIRARRDIGITAEISHSEPAEQQNYQYNDADNQPAVYLIFFSLIRHNAIWKNSVWICFSFLTNNDSKRFGDFKGVWPIKVWLSKKVTLNLQYKTANTNPSNTNN